MCLIWSGRKSGIDDLGPGMTAPLKGSLCISWVIHTFVSDPFSGAMRSRGGFVLSRVPDLINLQRVLRVALGDDSENAGVWAIGREWDPW